MMGLIESEHTALVQIAGANAADESGGHPPAYPSDQADLLLASALVEKGYATPVVPPGSVNSVYPLLDLQHGVSITPEGLAAISRPYVVGTVVAQFSASGVVDPWVSGNGGLRGLTDVLYGWSDGVVTWTMEREFS